MMGAMSMGPKIETSTTMTVDALITTLPATSAGIVTTIVRKTATMTKATPKGMTMTKNARQPGHHVHNVEDNHDDRKSRSSQSQSMDSIREMKRYDFFLFLAHTLSVIAHLVIWSIIIMWATKQPNPLLL